MNRLCDLLNIQYPIIQAPMNWVSGPNLVAAVSNAGGLGVLGPNAGARRLTPEVELVGERLRAQIKKVKSLSKKPFGVNIAIGKGEDRKYSQKHVEIAIEENVQVAIVSVGSPDVYTKELKEAGIKVLHAISTVAHAQKAEETGVDGVICEGFEAGGHKGFTELTTFVITPMVANAVKLPVVAGGGVCNARGVLAALALGADGVYIGTRFMLTHESDSHPLVKEIVLNLDDVCTISVPKDIMLARDLKNMFTKKYLEMKAAGASPQDLKEFNDMHSQYHAQFMGDFEGSEICCGQNAGLINSLLTAGEVIKSIADGIGSVDGELRSKLAVFSQESAHSI